VGAGLAVVAEPGVGVAQTAADRGLPGYVAEPRGGGQRGVVDGCELVPVPAPVEEVGHGPGKLPGAGIESALRGQGDSGGQNLLLGIEPGSGSVAWACSVA
jgi:hypothetical protein